MKAAVLHELGHAPQYGEFPDPIPQNDDQLLITIKAATIKNLDKGRASGAHYGAHTHLPEVVGVDGVGTLADGTRVFAMGITGMIAEKALIDRRRYAVVPDGVDDATAAALPNAVIGATLALRFRAHMAPGKTVLINGATGITGKVAIQVARYYGAKRIIATGRNPEALAQLQALGADDTISLKQDDEQIMNAIKEINKTDPIDIVIDYTWGHPAELIIDALKGGGMHGISHSVRFVTVGSMAGDSLALSSGILRSSSIEVLGSGLGSLPMEALMKLTTEILPEMYQLSAAGKLKIDTAIVKLADIEAEWNSKEHDGKRVVVVP